MSLNIKNQETCRLARELANLTGETMTGAITVALEERLEREMHERSVEARLREMRAIADRCAKLLRDGRRRSITAIFYMTNVGCPSDRRHVGGHDNPVWRMRTPSATRGR